MDQAVHVDAPAATPPDPSRCPLASMLARLGDKWSILAMIALARAPQQRLRFSEVMRSIGGISQRMLTTTLRHLERDGMLTREVFAEVPPRVEYTLTALGSGLLVPVESLVVWIEAHWSAIEAARAAYDQRQV